MQRISNGVPFAALHLANPGATVLAAATVAMAGLVFSAMYALTGRLWLPIGLHFAWNFAQGYLFGASVSGREPGGSVAVSTAHPGNATWLTGGAIGPEASVVALVLITAATRCALWLLAARSRQQRPFPQQHPEPLVPKEVTGVRTPQRLRSSGNRPGDTPTWLQGRPFEASHALLPRPSRPGTSHSPGAAQPRMATHLATRANARGPLLERKGPLTCYFVVAGAGFEPATSGL